MKIRSVLLVFGLLAACAPEDPYIWTTMEVTATAYNSVSWQTQGNPAITAWGDTLSPGDKTIAVSRDLIDLGLTHNTPVKIEGLQGIYRVNDKMNRRWRSRIDIYMGKDVQAAREWGRKKVRIRYGIKKGVQND